MAEKKYSIIYADPPWFYRGTGMHNTIETTSYSGDHYSMLTIAQLAQLDIPSMCDDDCLLFMWSTSPKLEHALDLIKQWGFKYITVAFVWDKQRVVAGNYTMSRCELCLVAKRGRIPKPRGARNIRQFVSVMRTTHSTKPDEVRDRITAMFPAQNKIELFARKKNDGWDCWGNEITSDVEILIKGNDGLQSKRV